MEWGQAEKKHDRFKLGRTYSKNMPPDRPQRKGGQRKMSSGRRANRTGSGGTRKKTGKTKPVQGVERGKNIQTGGKRGVTRILWGLKKRTGKKKKGGFN